MGADAADAADAADRPAVARAILASARYLTLATADADGRPWATPVWFALAGWTELCWVSRPGARHSRNIAVRPDVAIVVFDSTVPVGEGQGVYLEARAEEVPDAAVEASLAVFSAALVAQGRPPWQLSDVTGAAELRLYRARASRCEVLDEHDHRVTADPGAGASAPVDAS